MASAEPESRTMVKKRRFERRAYRVACILIAILCTCLGELIADEGQEKAARYVSSIESRLRELERTNKYGVVDAYLEQVEKAGIPADLKGEDIMNAIVDRIGAIAQEYDEHRRLKGTHLIDPQDWEGERLSVLFGFWKVYLKLEKDMRASVVSRSIENSRSPFMRLFLFELLERDPTAKVLGAGSAIKLLEDKRYAELPNPLRESYHRLCDFASKYLVTLIKESGARCELLERLFMFEGGIDERDRAIAELKQWLKDHPRVFEEAFGKKAE